VPREQRGEVWFPSGGLWLQKSGKGKGSTSHVDMTWPGLHSHMPPTASLLRRLAARVEKKRAAIAKMELQARVKEVGGACCSGASINRSVVPV
jgi:hypothetical protein